MIPHKVMQEAIDIVREHRNDDGGYQIETLIRKLRMKNPILDLKLAMNLYRKARAQVEVGIRERKGVCNLCKREIKVVPCECCHNHHCRDCSSSTMIWDKLWCGLCGEGLKEMEEWKEAYNG